MYDFKQPICMAGVLELVGHKLILSSPWLDKTILWRFKGHNLNNYQILWKIRAFQLVLTSEWPLSPLQRLAWETTPGNIGMCRMSMSHVDAYCIVLMEFSHLNNFANAAVESAQVQVFHLAPSTWALGALLFVQPFAKIWQLKHTAQPC